MLTKISHIYRNACAMPVLVYLVRQRDIPKSIYSGFWPNIKYR
ncbi:hypothetical protein [Citrobacter pasteurii]|nr:hypothetical protein SF123566_9910 [Shigella flexneri 1235-66]CEJ66762.1 hypothetical protein [Citrobacter pasteurii]